jgi:hypothetical protein
MAHVTERKRQEEWLTYLAGLPDNAEDAVVAMDEHCFPHRLEQRCRAALRLDGG